MKVGKITISHPERIVFPGDGITKLEVARYYERVGEWMMPHLAGRPLALLRAPDGIRGEMFFQKNFKAHVPDQVKVSELTDGTHVFHISGVAGLVSLAQFGAVEFHPWGARLPADDKPDRLVWDLDPDAAVPWEEVQGAAFLLRDFLAERSLKTLVKTSGGKGLHVVLALKRSHPWEVMKPFSKAVAEAVAAFNPRRFIVTSSLKKRTGKIYIDWLRNGRVATCVAPWSLRAREGAPVSMPVAWDDLAAVGKAGFTFSEPPVTPPEWLKPELQTVSKALLAELVV